MFEARRSVVFLVALLVLAIKAGSATTADETPTFHGIKLGISLDSQFKKCPWNPPKEGDIPEHIDSPYKDEKGNTIPCFLHWLPYTPTPNPKVDTIELLEFFSVLKDAKGEVLARQPSPGLPVVYAQVLVPASTQLGNGTIEEVMLLYVPLESGRVKEALVEKYGISHAPEKKVSSSAAEELFGVKVISREVWNTGWGEISLVVTDKDVTVIAETSKLMSFERDNKKDEF
jgi:hypothetical protein